MPQIPTYRLAKILHEPGGPVPERAASILLGETAHDIRVVLHAGGGRVDLVVSAIRDDNGGVELLVVDHGESIEIRAPRSLHVTAGTLRWHVGRRFGLSDLRCMILSVHGTVTTTGGSLTVTSD